MSKFVDIHVLQSVPSNNLNRDDAGSPKTAVYGGSLRARVSSQAWKRAMRMQLKLDMPNQSGTRTKNVPLMIANKMQELDDTVTEADAKAAVKLLFETAGVKLAKQKKNEADAFPQAAALMFVSPGQIEKLAEYALANDSYDKKEVKKALKAENSLDQALFGRMVADDPELNVDAASQVAHAISVNTIEPEFDYFVGADDLSQREDAGAAMIGTVEFNSSTLYRYANVNVDELAHNLGDDAAIEAVLEWIKLFVVTMPSGKQNTFAAKTMPNYVLVQVRDDTPINLASAFEDAIPAKHGYVAGAIDALEAESVRIQRFADAPVAEFVLGTDDGERNLKSLLSDVADALTEAGDDDEDIDA